MVFSIADWRWYWLVPIMPRIRSTACSETRFCSLLTTNHGSSHASLVAIERQLPKSSRWGFFWVSYALASNDVRWDAILSRFGVSWQDSWSPVQCIRTDVSSCFDMTPSICVRIVDWSWHQWSQDQRRSSSMRSRCSRSMAWIRPDT